LSVQPYGDRQEVKHGLSDTGCPVARSGSGGRRGRRSKTCSSAELEGGGQKLYGLAVDDSRSYASFSHCNQSPIIFHDSDDFYHPTYCICAPCSAGLL